MNTIPVASLKPNDRNPRTITPAALAKLAESIKRDPTFMELRPIIIDADGVILGGNQRFAACKKLGMTELPASWVRTAEGLTDEQQKRFVLVDNAPEGMAGEWDLDLLLADWQVLELDDLGFDLAGLSAGLPTGDEVPNDFKVVDENIATEHQCPKCGYRWSGGKMIEPGSE